MILFSLFSVLQTCADWGHEDLDRALLEDALAIGSALRGEAAWHEHAGFS